MIWYSVIGLDKYWFRQDFEFPGSNMIFRESMSENGHFQTCHNLPHYAPRHMDIWVSKFYWTAGPPVNDPTESYEYRATFSPGFGQVCHQMNITKFGPAL